MEERFKDIDEVWQELQRSAAAAAQAQTERLAEIELHIKELKEICR